MRAARQPRRARRPRLPVAPAATQKPAAQAPARRASTVPPATGTSTKTCRSHLVRARSHPYWRRLRRVPDLWTLHRGELTDRKSTNVSISSMRLTQRRVVALLVGAGLVVGVAAAIPGSVAATPAHKVQTSTYIVQMSDLPAAGYTGKVPGYSATKPANGAKLNARSADAVRYRGYLQARHDAVISSLGNIAKVYDYSVSFNGFAAQMTSTKAAQLAKAAGVLSVTKNEIRTADTVSTPTFLGP